MIIQKNFPDPTSPALRFYKPWQDYRNGFGDPESSYFWFGNEKLYQLLTRGNWKLRVDVQSNDTGKWYSAEYESLRLSGEASKYVLNVAGYAGDAGDAFNVAATSYHATNGMRFSTFDRDNDNTGKTNCAGAAEGGWWWNYCGTSGLNGNPSNWGTLKIYGLAKTSSVLSARMMIRPN